MSEIPILEVAHIHICEPDRSFDVNFYRFYVRQLHEPGMKNEQFYRYYNHKSQR